MELRDKDSEYGFQSSEIRLTLLNENISAYSESYTGLML